jgi:GTPase SAR1 family protein
MITNNSGMDAKNESLKTALQAVCQRNGLQELYERIDNIRAASIQVKVAFLGEFNAGKTTLVNALIKRRLLPVYDIPTTSVVTEIVAGNKDEAFVANTKENGDTSYREIPLWKLGDECTVVAPGKKIVLKLADLPFLPERTVLIDTPGIASIEEIHTDITMGYLPVIDIAFLVIHPVAGDIPKNMLLFLQKLPIGLLNKIYFIISRVDELNEPDKVLIKNKISASLGKYVCDPKILLIAGKMALDAVTTGTEVDEQQYAASNIKELLHIIEHDIPLSKELVERERLREQLLKEKETLLALLNLKASSLSWDIDLVNARITQFRSDIYNIEKEIKQVREKFDRVKQKTTSAVGTVVDEYAGAISHKIARDEPIDALIASMIQEMQQRIESGMEELRSIRFHTPGQGVVNIGDILHALIQKETSAIKEMADLITDAATFALTVYIVPGQSPVINAGEAIAGTSVVIAQELGEGTGQATHGSKKTDFMRSVARMAGAVGNFIKKINPLEKIKTILLPSVINPRLVIVMRNKVLANVSQIYAILESSLNDELEEKYLTRIRDKKALLIETERLKEEHTFNVDAESTQLQKDIDTITSNN